MPLREKTASSKNFAQVPRADIPRSKFNMRQTRKQAFNASELIPIMVEEVLPGDTWSHREHILARLATPIAPIIDDLDLETFYFFVPNRIVWDGWEDFITGTDTETTIPVVTPRDPGVDTSVLPNSVLDQMGILPQAYSDGYLGLTAFPIWGYFQIYNEWFRDQNLQEPWEWSDTWTVGYTDQITYEADPTPIAWDQMPLRANKRHDYFTSALPWAQKGGPVSLALTGNVPVTTGASDGVTGTGLVGMRIRDTVSGNYPNPGSLLGVQTGNGYVSTGSATGEALDANAHYPSNLYADLSQVTLATINQIRLAFQTQKLLERDARGGSRFVESILAHFGTRVPDYRAQRPEYLGGSKIPVSINPVAQTAAYQDPAANDSPLGNLGGEMHASSSKSNFTYAATEHGYIIGLACVRATPTYQQGTRRHWSRRTRLDYYFPVFAMLGEQAVPTQEIYQRATGTYDNDTWGYQEHWAELRYTPNEITGVLRSTATQPLDWWHLSEEFADEPALNADFITDKTQEVLSRALAAEPTAQWSAQIIMDIMHDSQVARLMPTYSVPGLIDHF